MILYDPTGIVESLKILDAWRAGDKTAGERLVRRHYAMVYRFFYSKVDPDTCQDLTQATLEALCTSRDAFRQSSSFATFVFGIARNKLLMHIRTTRRYRAVFDPMVDSCAAPEQDRSLVSLLGAHRQELLVARSLARLPLDDQILLELHDYEGLTRRQLADVFEIPPGTIATRVRRARLRVRELIEALADERELASASVHGLDSCMQSIRRCMDTQLRNKVADAQD